MARRTLLLLLCSLGFLDLSAQFAPRTPTLQRPTESANFALLRQAWTEDIEANRLLASVSHYAPTATFISPDGTHAEGQGAIRDLYTFVFAHFDATLQFSSRNTGQSGDLAYDSGAYTGDLSDRSIHQVHHLHGDYLTLYHREHAGVWLIVQQVWTAAPEAR